MLKTKICGLAIILIVALSGCGGTMSSFEDVYSFPEVIEQIELIHSSALETAKYIFTEDDEEDIKLIRKWFDNLELKKCAQPEQVDGNESYRFEINGEPAFVYDYHGSESAFIVVNDEYYKVKGMSTPPVENSSKE